MILFFPICQAAIQNCIFGVPAEAEEDEVRMSRVILGAGLRDISIYIILARGQYGAHLTAKKTEKCSIPG